MCQLTKRQIYFRCIWFAFLSSIQIIFTNYIHKLLLPKFNWFCFVLFGSFRSTRELFTHLETVAGLHILTYARHLWPLSSGDSSPCHIYCDTGLPLIMVISENPWHSHLMPSVWQWSCHYLFYRLTCVAVGIRPPNLPVAGLTHCITASAFSWCWYLKMSADRMYSVQWTVNWLI